MTVTETRPEHVAGEPAAAAPPAAGWLDSTDHKRIGLLFVYAALTFLVLGGVGGMLLRAELAERGVQLLEGDYGRAFSLHATLLTLVVLPLLWAGIASYIVPLQIGSNRVAFPRALATGLWLAITGGVLLLITYALDGLSIAGLTISTPVSARRGGASTADDLWVAAAALVALATFIVAVTLLATIARFRAVGMTVARVPAFTWSVLVSSAVLVLSTPVFLAGLLLLYLDQHFGGRFFGYTDNGTATVWQHLLWLFGRPEAFLLVLPGLGVACDVVATHARRSLLSSPAVRVALAAVGALSLTSWAAGTAAANAIVVPTYSALTGLVAVPLGVLALVLLGTVAKGRPRLHPSLLLVVSAFLVFGLAALNAGIAALVGVHGRAWTTGYLHASLFGPALLLAAASIYHWAPKLWGRHLPTGAGSLVALLLLGGSVVNAGASFLLGYAGAPWHVADASTESSWVALNRLAALGGLLLAAGAVLLVVEVARAAAKGPDAGVGADPYGGLTLEWATASPPPTQNFDALPPIDSAEPLANGPSSEGPLSEGRDA